MPLTKDQQASYAMRRSAGAQGWKFIELRLKDTYIHDSLAPIRVHGILDIVGQKGAVRNGRQQYNIYIKKNGVLKFDFNEDKAAFEAWLPVDEKLPGRYSEFSYNLDVLAGHWNNPIFDVVDYNGFEEEVKGRVALIKKLQAEKEAEKIRADAKARAQAELEVEEDLGAQESALEDQLKKVRLQKGLMKKDAPVVAPTSPGNVSSKSVGVPVGDKAVSGGDKIELTPVQKAAATRKKNKDLKEKKEPALENG